MQELSIIPDVVYGDKRLQLQKEKRKENHLDQSRVQSGSHNQNSKPSFHSTTYHHQRDSILKKCKPSYTSYLKALGNSTTNYTYLTTLDTFKFLLNVCE